MPGFLKTICEAATAPSLIDCYIYEWNAAQLRYQFLLRKFKNMED